MAKKKNYWNEEFMVKCINEWLCASTEAEYQHIYLKMHPTLHRMIEGIRQRYFTIPQHDRDFVNTKCMTKCFLSMDKYNPEYRAFSFFQTVIKNCMHEHRFVTKTWSLTSKYEDKRDEIDESDDYVLIDKTEKFDHKQELIEYLENYRFENPKREDVKLALLKFITEFEFNVFKEITAYLINAGHKPNDIKAVSMELFNKDFGHYQIFLDDELDNRTDLNVDIKDYYNDKMAERELLNYHTQHKKLKKLMKFNDDNVQRN